MKARNYKINFIECSAKESTNIEESFKEMAKNIMTRVEAGNIKKDTDKKKIKLNESVPLV